MPQLCILMLFKEIINIGREDHGFGTNNVLARRFEAISLTLDMFYFGLLDFGLNASI